MRIVAPAECRSEKTSRRADEEEEEDANNDNGQWPWWLIEAASSPRLAASIVAMEQLIKRWD